MKPFLGVIGKLIVAILVVWLVLVLYFSPILPEHLRTYGAVGFLIVYIATFFRGAIRPIAMSVFLISLLGIICCWATLSPRTDRVWSTEYQRMPQFEFDGDKVTIRNVRNSQYQNGAEPTVQYYDKVVKLSELSGLDLLVSYWTSKSIAHVMISFAFGEKEFVAISIETRREANESYSTLAGFFRNYELIYVVADERDVVRLRTTYRDPAETVYLFRTNMALATARRFFLDYANTINQLTKQPEFYNTALTNCTSQVFFHTRVNTDTLPYNWKIFFSGYVPEYLYEINALASGYSFEQLSELGKVNDRSVLADKSEDYSIEIRKGVPKPPPAPD